jgi:hypothetical protein
MVCRIVSVLKMNINQNDLKVWLIILGVLIVMYGGLTWLTAPQPNPPIIREPNWDSPQTRELAVRACFDCHSNETTWPWYSYLPPISWYIEHSVGEGRETFNFSDWGNVRGEARGGSELTETIMEGRMPPGAYLMIHSNARLTAAEKQALIDGLTATLKR